MLSPIHLGTAVITGASTGIGAVYADRLARRGYDLLLIARNRVLLDTLAQDLSTRTGRSVAVLAADLTQKQALTAVESRLSEDAAITLLINNAGTASVMPLLGSSADQMEAMIALNVTALTRLTYAVVPAMVARGGGAIINIASIVAVAPELLNGVYGASKAFVLAFSQALRHELLSKGIAVQAVLPGATRTPLWHPSGIDIDHAMKGLVMSPEDMVDAALAGFDAGEFATLPALSDLGLWTQFEAARLALQPHLSAEKPAARYLTPASGQPTAARLSWQPRSHLRNTHEHAPVALIDSRRCGGARPRRRGCKPGRHLHPRRASAGRLAAAIRRSPHIATAPRRRSGRARQRSAAGGRCAHGPSAGIYGSLAGRGGDQPPRPGCCGARAEEIALG